MSCCPSTAIAYYPALGIPIRRLLTDNGHCYRSHAFHAAVVELGLRHHFTRPYTPRTNGKAERFIQTALREWAYACLYQNSSCATTNYFPGFTTATGTDLMVASTMLHLSAALALNGITS